MDKSMNAIGTACNLGITSDALREMVGLLQSANGIQKLEKERDKPLSEVDADIYNNGYIRQSQVLVSKSPMTCEEKRAAYETVKKALGCSDELCVVKAARGVMYRREFNQMLTNNLKPAGPTGKEWLSNSDIDHTLQQFMVKFPRFYAYQFVMSDFSSRPLAGDFSKLKSEPPAAYYAAHRNSIDCIGCVMNTDVSTGQGIHWVAFFCDFRDASHWTVEFFDSGASVYTPFKNLCENTAADLQKIDASVNVEVISNTRIVHQKSSYECGAYALFYIYSRLTGVPALSFQNDVYSDSMMHNFRTKIFRESGISGGKKGKRAKK